MSNIIEIIDNKISEHRLEIDITMDEMLKVQKKVQENISTGVKDLQSAQKLFIIKSKLDFHRSGIAVLQDLKETINGQDKESTAK